MPNNQKHDYKGLFEYKYKFNKGLRKWSLQVIGGKRSSLMNLLPSGTCCTTAVVPFWFIAQIVSKGKTTVPPFGIFALSGVTLEIVASHHVTGLCPWITAFCFNSETLVNTCHCSTFDYPVLSINHTWF